MVYIATLLATLIIQIHSSRQVKVGLLVADKAFVKVLFEYSDYTDVFLFDLAIELPKNTSMNKYAIKLIERKQLSYGPIYNLKLVELEILKTYIEIHLKIWFIWPFKSLAGALIFFDQKLDGNFCLCIDYQGLNNFIIKNWYFLPLIKKVLDWLGQAKRFT